LTSSRLFSFRSALTIEEGLNDLQRGFARGVSVESI
jgi:hypothetical protein